MKNRSWPARLVSLLLAGGIISCMTWAAGTQGSEANPLVSLSYLTEKVIPDILAQVDARIDERMEKLSVELREEEKGKAVFLSLKVPEGKTVIFSEGAQLILRSGAAANTDGLTDLTDGSGMWGALKENHLYIATAEGQTVKVSSDAVFLVQGRYKVAEME